MTFKVFHKTGELRDAHGEWDGDEGYDVEIEIAEEKVHRDIAEMILKDYIQPLLDQDIVNYDYPDNSERYLDMATHKIIKLLDDLDCWDSATELYYADYMKSTRRNKAND